MTRLEGKLAIVTGAGQGIGAAIALRFAQEGARVVLAERDRETGSATARQIERDTGLPAVQIDTDVADPDSVAAMHDSARRAFGPGFDTVDILVNNAGINVFAEPLNSTMDDWRRCMSVDLDGVWHCCRQVLPGMIAQNDGAIINICSNHAMTVMPATFPYPVAKHGLLGLTRALGLEYAARGVAVNAISPGYTDTPLAQAFFARSDDPARTRADVEAKQPPGRLCRPSEVAAVAAMLASQEARFIIGENIVMDGGVSIRMYE